MNLVLENIKSIKKENIENLIQKFWDHLNEHGFEVGDSQIRAWKDCLIFLEDMFEKSSEIKDSLYIGFEYLLPFEGGRRPDVILFFANKIVVLEFKAKEIYEESDIEQAIGYREDLKNYHKETYLNNLEVETYLVLTNENAKPEIVNGIEVLTAENINEVLKIEELQPMSKEKVIDWCDSKYEPAPNVIDATLRLFKEGNLPYIKNIAEGDIEKAVKKVKSIIHNNEVSYKGKSLVFVSGVPGAGKTLVALKTLYDYNNYKYEKYNIPLSAVYLSGNGPLVNVLCTQLDNIHDVEENSFVRNAMLSKRGKNIGKTFIRGVRSFKSSYLGNNIVPDFNVIFFDEAQRAWDQEKMGSYNISEPEGLLSVGNKIFNKKGNATIVCFIGDGQVIHEGEEKGIELWIEALKKNQDWKLHIPSKYKDEFKVKNRIEVNDELFLDVSIRNNFIDVSKFTEAILDMNTVIAKEELLKMKEKGFSIRLTRNFDHCKSIIKEQCEINKILTYGMLISSKANVYKMKDILNNQKFNSFIKDTDAGRWFLKESKNLTTAASEFACQGLELDYPIVCFGGDYFIQGGEFKVDRGVLAKYKDKFYVFNTIVKNIYRVLLTRSRKGMIIFIPDMRELDETYEYFEKIVL
ncbi:DNA/RNA helicase domain-containing protein [Oceanirhabdus sp. W0125-5]|uniref:DNA/RNA helicase domain-containing protein n=1 Tax=Oceanirhabdus sp. W0125-5 TaxID=2999116 RepID=UPI0022F344F3|nr:DNA/RNA helicase domain-containing protein [Oceanirhabdus sp. W0125-5]WBW98844.1 DUF2075 domain-containing protein [Oceanirhabdus sp. W0125-5]